MEPFPCPGLSPEPLNHHKFSESYRWTFDLFRVVVAARNRLRLIYRGSSRVPRARRWHEKTLFAGNILRAARVKCIGTCDTTAFAAARLLVFPRRRNQLIGRYIRCSSYSVAAYRYAEVYSLCSMFMGSRWIVRFFCEAIETNALLYDLFRNDGRCNYVTVNNRL